MYRSFSFSEPADITHLIRVQEAAGYGFRNELYRPLLADEFRLFELMPGGRLPTAILRSRKGRVVVCVGDDSGKSAGPRDFDQARALLRWADRLMVHAAGGDAGHYRMVADAAAQDLRVVLIETTTAAEAAWMALVRRERLRRLEARRPPLPTVLVRVPAGQPPQPTAGHAP